MRKTILIIFILLATNLQAVDIETARESYYKATEEEEYIEIAINQFKNISSKTDSLKYLCNVYIGSLVALKATYTMWPQKKMEYANDGIEIMEKALENEYNNIESLFIYGTTTHYLPFFFGKSEDSDKALTKIIDLIDEKNVRDNKVLLKNALEFIIDKINPDEKRLEKAKRVLKKVM